MIGFMVIFGLVLNCILAYFAYDVAVEKGFPQSRYFVLPLFFNFWGLLIIAALPDRGNGSQNAAAAPAPQNSAITANPTVNGLPDL